MAKKFGKILLLGAVAASAVAGGVALFNKYKASSDDFDDDFLDYDDFDDEDFDDEDFDDEDYDDDEETIVDAFEDARETMDYKPADIEGMVTLYCKMKDTESQQEQERSVTWRDVADEMMTLHLRGIQTVMQGGNEQRRASVGVSALWWLAADRMRYGRVFQCAACGKVGIATDERGHKRRFCSDACKQWKSKHPNETRPPRQ